MAATSSGSLFIAGLRLFSLTVRRQIFSRQTLVGIGLTALCCLIALAWSHQREPIARNFAKQIVVPIYVAFLMPVLAICYGGAVVGGEREDRTLIYVLITPIKRPWIYLVKYLGANVLVAGWAGLALVLICQMAGEPGHQVFGPFLAASLLGAVAYASLFLLLGTIFRHGTVISLAYWFFLEVLFGNMPGIIKRVSVLFYVRCIIYDAGSDLELGPVERVAREMFLAVSGSTAQIVLASSIALLLILGLCIFSRREYRDLS